MNFLADQNIPRTCESLLKMFDHSLCKLKYDPNLDLNDAWLFSETQKQKAVFLTTDKDFFHTVPWLFSEHAGAIIVNLRKPNRAQILAKLEWASNF